MIQGARVTFQGFGATLPVFQGFGATLSESERKALAQRIFDIVGPNRNGFAVVGVKDIFLAAPPEDREDIARQAIILGADPQSVQRSLESARATEPQAPEGPERGTVATPKIIAGALIVGTLGLIGFLFWRRR